MPELKSPTKFKVLSVIWGKGGIETRELAEKMQIRVPHASKLLRAYWIQGLLKRSPRPMDQGGTRYFYSLSELGKKRLIFFLKKIKKMQQNAKTI